MKSRFIALACVFSALVMASSFAFAAAASCDLYRIIDKTDEASTNSDFVKGLLQKKGYTVKDIYSIEEAKTLPEGSYWGFFRFKSVKKKSKIFERFDVETMVTFYKVEADSTSPGKTTDRLLFYNDSTGVEKKGLTTQDITNSLGFISD